METGHQHDDDSAPPETGRDAPDRRATLVAEQVEHARGKVFRAYVRARERAHELGGDIDGPR